MLDSDRTSGEESCGERVRRVYDRVAGRYDGALALYSLVDFPFRSLGPGQFAGRPSPSRLPSARRGRWPRDLRPLMQQHFSLDTDEAFYLGAAYVAAGSPHHPA
ncbi:MAG: hypothetical protein ABJF88_11755 [Rhodothermales bacterium]